MSVTPAGPPDEDSLAGVLASRGPCTGAELIEATGAEPLALWRTCRTATQLCTQRTGRHYLRLDRHVDGEARLSPSIRREFLTYTVIGRLDQREGVARRAAEVERETDRISRVKWVSAREAIGAVLDEVGFGPADLAKVTFLLAGDVVYGMSHVVPRPESSTGRLVRGSDLDIIGVVADDLEPAALARLDEAIHRRKHFMLVQPTYREEIDYVLKRLATVRDQLAFDTFEHRVASKILDEGRFLAGSADLFAEVARLVDASGVAGKLADLTTQAQAERFAAQAHLLDTTREATTGEFFNLFYTSDEGDEIY